MQTTLWTVEKELEAYFRVLDVIPAALPTFLLLLESIPVDLDGPSVMIRVHLALIQAMLSHLLPDFNDAERDEGEISLAEEDILSHVTAAIVSVLHSFCLHKGSISPDWQGDRCTLDFRG